MSSQRVTPLAFLLGLFAAGCGAKSAATPTPDAGADAGPPQPLMADVGNWTWNDVDGAFCADGSPTGVAVNLSGNSTNVAIYLEGGGACWDYDSCYSSSSTAVHIMGGFDASNMPFLEVETTVVGVYARNDPTNPLQNFNVVSVPYCTGDAFTGNHVATYKGMPTHHVGHANIMAILPRIVATFPNAQRVVLVGSSAGGIGVAYNWWWVQQAFGNVRVDMIDDSGAALPPPYLKPSLVATWQSAWDLDSGLPPGCADCRTSLDALVTWNGDNIPNGKGALLEYTRDSVFPGFLGIPTKEFTQGLSVLADRRISPLPRFKYFFVKQASHVLMVHPDLSQNGVRLWDWIPQMLNDDPAWESVHPYGRGVPW
jgi:hypothetical protein